METIIVPIDFSPTADNAMHFGAQLAQSINCRIHLLHVYQIPVSISDIPVMTISGEELKKSADEGLERCRDELRKAYPINDIQAESRLGEVITELKMLCEETNPFAVIIGSHKESTIERLLFGSTALSVIRNLPCPVIVVSSEAQFTPIQNVVYATDLKNINSSTVQKISGLVQRLRAELHIVHVNEHEPEQELQEKVNRLVQYLQPVEARYHEINDENVVHGIQTYVQENKADLTIVVPHKHAFWEHFFSKTNSETVLLNPPTPVLFLPE